MERTCRVCGNTYPLTSEYFPKQNKLPEGLDTRCKGCYREYQHGWRTSNKEHLKESRVNYYKQNKEKIGKINKEWKEINRDKMKEIQKDHYLENKDLYKERSRRRREEKQDEPKEYFKKHYQENRERKLKIAKKWAKTENGRESIKRTNERRRTQKKGLKASLTKEQWLECLYFFDHKCAYCRDGGELQQDHFVPLSKQGEYSADNIIPACKRCNTSKSAQKFKDWYPKQDFYSNFREKRIYEYLHYAKDGSLQQLSIL